MVPPDEPTIPDASVAGATGERVRKRPRDDGDAAAPERGGRRRRKDKPPKSQTRNMVEWAAVLFGAIIVAVIVRTFLFQTFYIPSESMTETLQINDRVVVNKLSYKFGDVERGDVVVFERPGNDPALTEKDLIKRVIGLPGDRVSITEGSVKIDGKELDEPYTSGQPTDASVACGPGEVTGLNTAEGLKIPAGHVLVLGDNRTHSHDGRCFGPIDEDLIVGRAMFIIWPPSHTGGL
ncbi:signal peptidase I [Aquihabitans sp. G128]|uniref:signal peptidase I n=1 Tax=Aquihabitans sp. G128 TaxID=2849779 RepID=UPI001C224898|nr:signal peptidase I [Aquihabitans sp. G128]QXC62032.1 signal peptidase I [Aquihabitans sp. G128]